jgi:predicted TIM-barrel fold metal-dependent hydrolase
LNDSLQNAISPLGIANQFSEVSMPYVDTHAHIFLRDLPMIAGRRYTPEYDCNAESYLSQLSESDVGHGVLVQPSFLGTDNSYMLAALDRYPDRLRGIAVVSNDISEEEIEAMDFAGVVGIRFNTIGKSIDQLGHPEVAALLARIQRFGWQVEVQARARDLPAIFRYFASFQGPIVIDHFGLPDPLLGVRDPGFRALLSAASSGEVYVKMSAGYRCGQVEVGTFAGALLAMVGPRRLLWGSDWPFTQFESGRTYSSVVADIRRLVPDRDARGIMDATATNLFRFS